jgi:hypothetical protein
MPASPLSRLNKAVSTATASRSRAASPTRVADNDLLLAVGRLGEAEKVLERALEIARNAGERPGELRAQDLLGVIRRLGSPA